MTAGRYPAGSSAIVQASWLLRQKKREIGPLSAGSLLSAVKPGAVQHPCLPVVSQLVQTAKCWGISRTGRIICLAARKEVMMPKDAGSSQELETLQLWSVLHDRGSDQQRQMVRNLVDYAAPMLDRVVETFPTYTLHNRQHARNVAELMAKLLGDQVNRLNPLEAALLVLSAYWHDIGMAIKKEEIEQIATEPNWEEFLRKPEHAEAYLAVNGDLKAKPPVEIAEWYCRWRHADRVFDHLEAAKRAGKDFKWGSVDIGQRLGYLCLSHNEDITWIATKGRLSDNYLEEADVRFCAILLRLADILDFDGSRSPESVYQFLGLKRRTDQRTEASDTEWRKHLVSDGFRFPEKRSADYELGFVAGPDHPAVEHDVRQFLHAIEDEFKHCTGLLRNCSKRWRDFFLPGRISRENIIANGYTYGEYRFSLDQRQIIELLMGERLYQSPYAFVREMLQNALDASRLRSQFERMRGRKNFEAEPIRVSEWFDKDRHHWIRFDDYGTGMDDKIIQNHLLKVGSSYYQSSDYRADILRATRGSGADFVPISRFGIGLLSCFGPGDRVEITTLRKLPDGKSAQPIRLSLDGMHGYYILQKRDGQHDPRPMPSGTSSEGEEPGYRSEPGTSIAIRLDARKERKPIDIRKVLDNYLLFPSVPVELGGKRRGGDPKEFLETPLCEPTTVELTPEETSRLLRGSLADASNALKVDIIPLNLTAHSPTSNLKGQLVLVHLRQSQELRSFLKGAGVKAQFELRWTSPSDFRLSVHYPEEIPGRTEDLQDGRFVEVALNRVANRLATALPAADRRVRVSHNGILLPTQGTPPGFPISPHMIFGFVSLADSLRPELSVGREYLQRISWDVYSAIHLAVSRSLAAQASHSPELAELGQDVDPPALIEKILFKVPYNIPFATILEDPWSDQGGYWAEERILDTSEGVKSLKQVVAASANGRPVELMMPIPPRTPVEFVAAALAQRYFELRLVSIGEDNKRDLGAKFRICGKREKPIEEGEKLFQPFRFVSFGHDNFLRGQAQIVNRGHAFSAWFLRVAPRLAESFPGLFSQIRDNLFRYVPPHCQESRREINEVKTSLNEALKRLKDLRADLCQPSEGAWPDPLEESDLRNDLEVES